MLCRVIRIITAALLLAATVFVLVRWANLPEQIPVHFNFKGEPDGYGGKWVIIFEAVMAWGIFATFAIVSKFPNKWNMPVKVTPQNKAKLYGITRIMLEVMNILTVLMFIVLMVSAAMATVPPGWLIMVLIGLILAVTAVGIALMYKYK